ncbi:MAG TPA: demethoxyubiquinone hydroxylase family protein [Porticoccaceae bacterium]|jgi:ubiquinone biosynthesis monooxygenase Coq7|nr:demethoxyubiquinone hydroxylase family protein [Porticoccaceae bacterium]
MSSRQLSLIDKFISQLDHGIRTVLSDAPLPGRKSPAVSIEDQTLNEAERSHALGLMRVNHTGEVCAQALYQGQALTAKLPDVREQMKEAATEEIDHLSWCEDRIKDLGGRTSVFNPIFYAMSFGIGAGAGIVSDKLSLGFVAATEDQVCAHLKTHLDQLPETDHKSRAVVKEMLADEERHAQAALDAGGYKFPTPVKQAMTLISSVMTKGSYKI